MGYCCFYNMTDTVLLPTADAIIQPVIDKLIELRPNSEPYLTTRTGVYWHPVLGFRGQAAKMLARLALLAAERRLKTAEGKPLLDYVASEFDAVPETDKTTAEGTVTLSRGTGEEFPGGDYPKGTRLNRAAYTMLGVDYEAAEYETLTDAHIDADDEDAEVTIPIRATRAGAHANHPILENDKEIPQVSIPNLVDNMIVSAFQASGGSEGPDDPFVRLYAKTYSLGQYGPTEAASKLGVLFATGVRHFLVYDEPVQGTETTLIADASWGSADRWAAQVQQSLYDNDFVGFGCKVYVGKVINRAIYIVATVSLRDGIYLAETTDVTNAIAKAVRAYFDDRPDWNTWSTNGLRAAITRAHSKVYQCNTAVMRDAATNQVVDEVPTADFTTDQYHYLLAANAMKITYSGPS